MEPNIQPSSKDGWLSMAEASLHTPYSAEYLSLLARRGKLSAKKVDGTWYTTKQILDDYMKKQMLRVEVQNGNLSAVANLTQGEPPSEIKTEVKKRIPSLSNALSDISLPNIRSYESDMKKQEERDRILAEANAPKIPLVAKTSLPRESDVHHDIEKVLEKVIDKKFFSKKPVTEKISDHAAFVKKTLVNKSVLALALVSIIFFTFFPVPFVFSFVERSIEVVKEVLNDANTVMGFRPGTHANELLLLDKNGNIAITGRIETYVEDGVAPIVVTSKTRVDNLNADYIDNLDSSDFTLAFVTKNGSVTTEDVTLSGNVEVGQTLLVRGATRLMESLSVDGDISVLGNAEFNKILRVLGPSYFEGVVRVMNDMSVDGNLTVRKNINTRGSITSGSSVIGKRGSFDELSGGEASFGEIESPLATLTRVISESVSVGALTATSTLVDELTAGSSTLSTLTFGTATGTAATTTDLFSTNATFTNLFATNFNLANATITSSSIDNLTFINATGTNSTTTNATTTNFFSTNANITNTNVTNLSWTSATGTSATTTNLFSIYGTFTNLVGTNANLSNLIFNVATGTSATTTNFFSTTASSTNLFSTNANIGVLNLGSGVLSNLLLSGSSTLQNFTFVNATGMSATTTNLFSNLITALVARVTSLVADDITVGALTATNSTTTSATTTSLYVGGLASTTELRSNTGTIGTLTTGPITSGLINGQTISSAANFTGSVAVGSNLTATGGLTSLSNLLLSGSSTLQNFTFVNATGTSATTTNFFSNTGRFDDLYVNDYQQNDGTFSIVSTVATGDIVSILDNAITNGTLLHQIITANAGNGQTSYGQVIDLVDATVAGGGYTGLAINVSGAGVGSGDKLLLDLDAGSNKQVVFDSAGAFRPTASSASNVNSLGSPSFYWKNAYVDTITANNLSGTVISGDTSSNTWTIGSDETGDTTKSLIFQRNSGSGNAIFSWNASSGTLNDQRFLSVNYPFNSTYTVNDASISTSTNLYSGLLTNNTTAGIQRLLSLTNTGTGATETGVYINNTGTGTTALEIAGTWANGLLTNNNSVNIGTGGLIFGTATGTSATTTNLFSTNATFSNLFGSNLNLSGLTANRLVATDASKNLVSTITASNLLSSVVGTTGTGDLVFGTSPTFTTQITTPSIITASGALGITPASGSNLNVNLSTTGDFAVNTNQLYVDTSTANVGIGTAVPSSGTRLDIRPQTVNHGVLVYNDTTTIDGASVPLWLTSKNSSSAIYNVSIENAPVAAAAANMVFRTGSNSVNGYGTTAMTILGSNQNVGIGSVAPTNRLSILPSANRTSLVATGGGISVGYNSSTISEYATIGFHWPSSIGDETSRWGMGFTGTNFGSGVGDLFFYTGGTEKVRVTSAGNVGIGTTTPANKLDVYGSSRVNVGVGRNLFVVTDATQQGTAGVALGSFNDTASAYAPLSILGSIVAINSNVGIGTTTPIAPLNFANTVGTKIIFYDNRSTPDRYGIDVQPSELRMYSGAAGATTGGITFGKSDGTTFTESMRIRNDGNVGIGTTGPGQKLTVSDSASNGISMITTANVEPYFYLQRNSGSNGVGVFRLGDGGALYFDNGATGAGQSTKMTILNNGNVGIGVTPTAPLHLNANTSGATVYSGLIENTNTDTGVYNVVRFMQGAAGSAIGYIGTGGSTTGNTAFNNTFVVGTQNANSLVLATNDTRRLTIDASGNVGIGTASPNSRLEVAAASTIDTTGSVNKWTIKSRDLTTSAAGVGGSLLFQGYKSAAGAVGNFAGIAGLKENATDNNEQGYLAMYTVPSSGVISERMRIDSSGNVGIGIGSPGYKLHVVGGDLGIDTTAAQGYPDLIFSGSGLTNVSLKNDSNRLWAFSSSGTSMRFNIAAGYDNDKGVSLVYTPGTTGASAGVLQIGQDQKNNANFTHGITTLLTNGIERMRINASGNVGIGTLIPGAKLHVVGDTIFGGLYTSSDFSTTFALGTDAWIRVATVDNYGYGTIRGTIGSTNSEETFEVKYKTSYVTNQSSIIVERQSYNPRLLEVRLEGADGAPKTIFMRVRTSDFAPIIYFKIADATGVPTIHNNIVAPAGAVFATLIVNGNTSTNSNNNLNIAGNVGIGTTAPVAKLDVSFAAMDGLRLYQTSGGGNGQIILDTNFAGGNAFAISPYIAGINNGGFSIRDLTMGVNRISILPTSGFVGIGDNTPNALLEVQGDNSNNTVRFSDSTGQFRFRFDQLNDLFLTNSAGTDVVKISSNNGNSTFFNSGNVGIGTTAPQSALDVLTSANTFVSVGSATLGVGQYAGIHFGYRESNTNYRKSAIVFERTDNSGGGGNAAGKVHILNGPALGGGSATLADARLTIGETGNVGIGTTAPNRKLDIYNSANNGDGLTIGQDADNSQTIQAYIDSNIAGGGFANRTTYAGGCCNTLKLQPDVGAVQLGSSFTVSNAGVVTGAGTYNGQTISSAANFTGTLTVASASGITTGNTSSRIYMNDSDESTGGSKSIHANSNVIGFLNGAGSWQTYWDHSGNQQNAGQVTASQFNGSGAGLTILPVSILTTANGSWGGQLAVGGNGGGSGVAAIAKVQATDGNLHLDPGVGKTTYINYYHGSGVNFGNGASGVVASVSSAGLISGSSFSGAGTGLTGTAASLSIGGNAGSASVAYGLAGAGSAIYGTTGTSFSNAVQVREANLGGAQGGGAPYQPRLGFHWGGVVASSITMESSGRIAIVDNPGTGYENFVARDIKSTGGLSVDGSVGIGTTATSKFTVSGESNFFSGTYSDPHVGTAYDSKFGGSNRGIAVRGISYFASQVTIGTAAPTATLTVSGDIYASGSIQTGGCFTSPNNLCLDLAEEFPVSDYVEAGDILAVSTDFQNDSSEGFSLNKASTTSRFIGIVSTAPAILLQGTSTSLGSASVSGMYAPGSNAPVALAGRVPVKFTLENGSIKEGDYLTISTTTPGKATKAVSGGMVIGQALTSSEATKNNRILVFVNHFYWAGNELEELKTRLAQVEMSLSQASASLTISTSTPGFVASVFESMKASIVDGVTHFVRLAVESLTTNALTVGKSERPSGITIYDEVTGLPYCFKMKNGFQHSDPGECVALASSTSPQSSPSTTTTTSTTTTSTTTTATTTPETATTSEQAPEPTPQAEETATTTTSTTTPTTTEEPPTQTTTPEPQPVVQEPAPAPTAEPAPEPTPTE